jgi:dipeptidyl aminopeptidase/acylaminoacyl peptidase
MPWDGTDLWIAEFTEEGYFLEDGPAGDIVGGPGESIYQPSWSPDGTLYFISDRTGWWNLYRWKDGQAEALWPKDAEFGLPQWVFRRPTYGFESADSLLCVHGENGVDHLTRLDLNRLTLTEIPTPFTRIDHLHVGNGFVVFIGGSPTRPNVVAKLDLKTGKVEELARASRTEIDPGYLSEPQPIEFPTANGRTAFAFYYPPRNKDFTAPAGEKPPLVVHSHGGPTGATTASFRPSYQYWTSRGFAVVDVNYGGSTGYGRAYRERLRGQWGVVDVEDCVAAAEFLVPRGEADPDRLCITGGSAGGYTTLCALTFTDVFAAGASLFGLSDLVLFVGDTHKFESRYLDSLVGPFPERRDLYEARSAVYHAEKLNCPVIFFQGDEDKIVPPNQAEVLVEALKQKGVPVAYVPFAGEQHGFRKAENIRRSVDGEFYFYSRVFGFEPADELEPVEICNLD